VTYYVYGLTDHMEDGYAGVDLLSSVFYVGKGVAGRWDHHLDEVEKALERGLETSILTNQAKVQRIVDNIGLGGRPRSVKLASGLETEADAYIAEALAIELVNAVLVARNLEPLTNVVSGHGRSVMDLEEHRYFVEARDLTLEPVEHDGRDMVTGQDWQEIRAGDIFSAIFVKMGTRDFEARVHRATRHSPHYLGRAAARVVVMDEGQVSGVRKGWNPNTPWTADEAHERAYRYWSLAKTRVEGWIYRSATAPSNLVGLVPDRSGSVARYVWPIDPGGVWERYPTVRNRWGIPVINKLHPLSPHPLLGRRPVSPDGRAILHTFASGVRAGVFRVV